MSQYQKPRADSSDLAASLFPSCPIETRINHLFPFYRRRTNREVLKVPVNNSEEQEKLTSGFFPCCPIETRDYYHPYST
jgi:hypothetical protein